jgi:histidine triad (HIT) family protein
VLDSLQTFYVSRRRESRRWLPFAQRMSLTGVIMADDCLFCRIVRGEIPATIIFENAACIAFRDIDPKAPTHMLIVPREHIPSLNEAKDRDILGALLLAAAEIANSEGIAAAGYRTVINTNSHAGQTVFHLHVHLLGGRALTWPPG